MFIPCKWKGHTTTTYHWSCFTSETLLRWFPFLNSRSKRLCNNQNPSNQTFLNEISFLNLTQSCPTRLRTAVPTYNGYLLLYRLAHSLSPSLWLGSEVSHYTEREGPERRMGGRKRSRLWSRRPPPPPPTVVVVGDQTGRAINFVNKIDRTLSVVVQIPESGPARPSQVVLSKPTQTVRLEVT